MYMISVPPSPRPSRAPWSLLCSCDCLRVDTAFQQSYTLVLRSFFYASHAFILFAIGIYGNCGVKHHTVAVQTIRILVLRTKWTIFLLLQIATKTRNSTTPGVDVTMTNMFVCIRHSIFDNYCVRFLFSFFSTCWNFIWIRFQRHMSLLFIYLFALFLWLDVCTRVAAYQTLRHQTYTCNCIIGGMELIIQ